MCCSMHYYMCIPTLYIAFICIFSHPMHRHEQATANAPTVTHDSTITCIFAHPTHLYHVYILTPFAPSQAGDWECPKCNANMYYSMHHYMYIRTPYTPIISIFSHPIHRHEQATGNASNAMPMSLPPNMNASNAVPPNRLPPSHPAVEILKSQRTKRFTI